ncbi:CdaR family protein [Vagococcus lutrae]|uniref:CdaR family protein n=1 Tax=Vagococcus lutrae TaxID=81947 RepID=UPI00200DDFB1|nr:CdaR family protein [Vagococcus lutrae]MDT2805438.1 CdaR family protein [Vagococcus lutrae]UQF19480.1 CdaR family protein [Vagococcus lutrae]
MINKLTTTKAFTIVLSFMFAMLLFFNANPESRLVSRNEAGNTMKELSDVAENVKIKLIYDDQKYFVSGYEEETNVYLQSANKVLLDTEKAEETRNFSVVADLTDFKEGTYEVPLKIDGLNRAVSATLEKESIFVTLERRKTSTFKVSPRLNDSLLKQGYDLTDITVDPETVSITAGEQTLQKISDVIVSIDDKEVSSDFTKQVTVLPIDDKGNVLGVIAVPSVVTVRLTITAPTKSVPIKVNQSGSIPEGVASYRFEPTIDHVKVTGPREALDQVEEAVIIVDTSSINRKTTQSYRFEAIPNVTLEPTVTDVTVIPEMKPTKETSEKNQSSSKEKEESKVKETDETK